MIEVHYTSELIDKNTEVKPLGCNSLSFENIGSVAATIDNTIPLSINDTPREFLNENPNAQIVKSMNIIFGAGSGKSVLVIRTFKKEIK